MVQQTVREGIPRLKIGKPVQSERREPRADPTVGYARKSGRGIFGDPGIKDKYPIVPYDQASAA